MKQQQQRRGRSRRGFTMLEMLVAITLLSVMTVGFFMALRVGLNAMERTSVRMDENRRMVGVARTLDRQVAGIVPAMATCGYRRMPIFAGSATALRLVTSHSLAGAGRGFPQLLEYLIVPGQAPGSSRLIVNEMPYAGPGSVPGLCDGTLRTAPGPGSFVLADRLAAARFTYLYESPMRGLHEWRPDWIFSPALTQGSSLPAAIRIEMTSLPGEPAHMRFAPLTLRVHVNRMPNEEYLYVDVEPPPRYQ